jgi:hypothetical protein
MAQSVQIAPERGFAKIRNPWAVLGLSLITLGIYYVFWWYFINREMRDVGNANGVDLGQSPGVSVLAITVGAFVIIPPFVSIWKTGRRMEGTQRATGVSGGNGPLFFLLEIIPIVSLFAPVYMQMELNKAWHAIGAAETGQASELPAARGLDAEPLSFDSDEGAVAEPRASLDSAEGERPPAATPAQENGDDAT